MISLLLQTRQSKFSKILISVTIPSVDGVISRYSY
jgi:hypothetical protein